MIINRYFLLEIPVLFTSYFLSKILFIILSVYFSHIICSSLICQCLPCDKSNNVADLIGIMNSYHYHTVI